MIKKYFISGHGDLTFEEFIENYKPLIDAALIENHLFVLCDFRGCDVLAMEYLKNKTSNVIILHCFDKPRYYPEAYNLHSSDWTLTGGFRCDIARDMTATSLTDYDIAWVRKGRDKSGTAKNIKRR